MADGAVRAGEAVGETVPHTQHPDAVPPGYELLQERRQGLLRRFFTTLRHFLGLLLGAFVARVREKRRAPDAGGISLALQRLIAFVARLPLDRKIADQPFPVQFRRRLELMGPTYIKLGQVLGLRRDVLPKSVTDELEELLDRLPVVTFKRYRQILEKELGRPVDSMFTSIEATPLGSASIAQIHRAWTIEGDAVILKLVKPGIRETLQRDAILLRSFGRIVQWLVPRYQPSRIIDEFVRYTEREVDMEREADNAETFAANFRDLPDIVFPRIYRQYSSRGVLCQEYLKGVKPSEPQAERLSDSDKDQLIDLGAQAVIRMLYRDGFFHADLHPGNLLILQGPRCGFIDLGMVGRFDDELRRTLLYYFYCLVMGDAENAARFLVAIGEIGPGSDPVGFRREVEDICRRWSQHSSFEEFSLGELVLRSLGKAGRYRVYFPVEMVLMVKALITYEAVGHMLRPGLDVAKVSRRHVNAIFLHQFNPVRVARQGLRGAPEVVDALLKAPMLVTEGLRVLERATRAPRDNPLKGLRSAMFAGACVIGGAIVAAFSGPSWLAGGLLGIGGVLMLLRPK